MKKRNAWILFLLAVLGLILGWQKLTSERKTGW